MKGPKRIVDGDEGGVFRGIADHLKLVWRLWQDNRINPFLKLLPFSSLIYVINPLDMIIPVVDDVGVVWLFTYMFIELSPQEIVEEHRAAIQNTIRRRWKDEDEIKEEDIIDADYKEKDSDE